jgi:hypothetical protein
VFDALRAKLNRRRNAKRRAEFDRMATESEGTAGDSGEPRARDLPDPLGDFNEMQRMGPTIGGTGGTTGP